MSRFAANPKWLIYLPPTMSPSETSKRDGLLGASRRGIRLLPTMAWPSVVVEQKHMGSRAIVIVCRDEEAALQRFGVARSEDGICYTRTGRRFFEDSELERELLAAFAAPSIGAGAGSASTRIGCASTAS